MASSPIQSILKIEDLTSEDEARKATKDVLYEECLVDDQDEDEPMLTMNKTSIEDTPSTSYRQSCSQNKTTLEDIKSSGNRMSFKIVQITEHNQTYLTVVPSAWERLGNLYWPNTTNLFIMQKLIQNSSSIPERYWLSQPCILKKSNFQTFEAAKTEIERMDGNTDSKGYFNDTTNSSQAQKRHSINQKLFKKLLPQEGDVTTNIFTSKDSSERDNTSQINLRETDCSSVLENISKNINQILKKQNKILIELANQNEFNGVVIDRLDQLNKNLSSNEIKASQINMNEESSIQDDSNAISIWNLLDTPISQREELNELEINLNDNNKMEYLISKMKVICGEGGLLDATYCCYNLVDRFFTRSFLLNVSWSGGSSTESGKLGLKNYRNVLCVFNKLVILASKDFNENKSQEFFQKVLNNAKKRHESEIDNTSRDPEEKQTIFPDDFNTISMLDLLNNPISNEEDLNKLELNLKDPTKVEYLITKMRRICGDTGYLDSTNCCYTLVDRFFTRSFLTNVTWSGGSRTGSSKLALKKYRNILDVFNRLVALASKDFNECKSKDFFQNVLKNSKTRYMSEIDHIPRRSAKKVRKQKEQVHTNNESEDNTLINGVEDDVNFKCEFQD